jgi:4-amino-4-deoxy-L-arabinose transferase-like glycosyltransferase
MALRHNPQDVTAQPPARRRRGALLVAVFAALLVLPPVGHHLIVKSDEARFALLARDVLRRGAWLAPEVEGQPYRNKPLLFPWTIAALSKVTGAVTETTAQLPSAAAAVAAAVFAFLLGDKLFGRRAGVWAGLILVTSASFFGHSQQILPDMLVVAFATACVYAFWRAVSESSPRALVCFYAALAFALFAKGPVGLLPVLTAGCWLVSEHGVAGLRRLWSGAGLAVFAVITLVWLAPFLYGGSQSFGEGVLLGDWLVTYIGLPLPRRVASFVGDAVVGCLPWTGLLLLAVGAAVAARRNPAVRFALLTFAVPLLAIIFSRSRLPRYLLPIYPGAALLVAWWADAHGSERSRLKSALGWASFAGLAVGGALLPRLLRIFDAELPPDPALIQAALPLVLGALLVGLVFLVGLHDGRPALLVVGGVAVTSALLGYGVWLIQGATDRAENFKALAAVVRRHAPDGDLRVFTQAKLLPLDFYYGQEIPRVFSVDELRVYLAQDPRPIVVIDDQDLKVTPRELLRDLRVLDSPRIHEQNLYIIGRRP